MLACEVTPEAALLRVRGEGLVTLVVGRYIHTESEAESTVIASRARRVTGLVSDEAGNAIEGASIALHCNADFGALLRADVAALDSHLETVTTDVYGRFTFATAAEMPKAMLAVKAVGFEHQHRDIVAQGDVDVAINLKSSIHGETALRGRVVRADGGSTKGAQVIVVGTGRSTDIDAEDGLFELEIRGTETLVYATYAGLSPARFERTANEPWPQDFVLELGGGGLINRGARRRRRGPACGWVAGWNL